MPVCARHRHAADFGLDGRDAIAELVGAFEAQKLLDRGCGSDPGSSIRRAFSAGQSSRHFRPLPIRLVVVSWPGVEQEDAVVQQFLALRRSPPSSPWMRRVSTSISGSPRLGAALRRPRPSRYGEHLAHGLVAARFDGRGQHRLERAEDRERPAAQRLALVVRHAEQVADDLDRDRAREGGDQVDFPGRGHAVEQAVDELHEPASIAAMWRGVSAPPISRRTRVCSGGSLKTRLVVWCS